jgi:Subtilase family/Secretion system C-terminal sorting domain
MLRKKLLCRLVLACMLFPISSFADDIVQIRFASESAGPSATVVNDSIVTCTFSDANLTTIFSGYSIRWVRRAYPRVWELNHPLADDLTLVFEFSIYSNASSLMTQLNSYSGSAIVNKYILYPPGSLTPHTPNDYNSDIVPCDSAGRPLSYLELIKARDAWGEGVYGDTNIKVAVTDNGFNKNHQDLIGKIANPNFITSYQNHGTAVLGYVGANTNNNLGISAIGYNTRMLAYDWAFQNFPQAVLDGAKVINCSWTTGCYFNQNDQDMITVVHDLGIVVVAAAGNGGTCGSATAYVYPASYDHVISVSAVGHYHDRGTNPCGNGYVNQKDVHWIRANSSAQVFTAQHNDKVDICAPGYGVWGLTTTGYQHNTGTSLASPIVAGLAGLLFSIESHFTPDEIEGILKCTAFNLDSVYENAAYIGLLGAGRIDAHQAVLKAKRMVYNKPSDISWFYYTDTSNAATRVDFHHSQLATHISAGNIDENLIFFEATSPVGASYFDWEFIKGDCRIQKSGYRVSFDLDTDCPTSYCNLVVHVKNSVTSICDTLASTFYREAALFDSLAGCYETYRRRPAEAATEVLTENKDKGIRLFPNPAVSTVNLEVPDPASIKQALLIAPNGQVLRRIQLRSRLTAIDTRGLPGGVYFLRLEQDSGPVVKKLIIQQ